MISNIINSNGVLVYTGNDIDSKFATVLARAGHSRVDGDAGDEDKPKWDGEKWIDGKTAMEAWQEDMEAADREHSLPRYAEDILDGMADKSGVAQITLDRLQAKKDKRSEKP
jgi:hypothetical protein